MYIFFRGWNFLTVIFFLFPQIAQHQRSILHRALQSCRNISTLPVLHYMELNSVLELYMFVLVSFVTLVIHNLLAWKSLKTHWNRELTKKKSVQVMFILWRYFCAPRTLSFFTINLQLFSCKKNFIKIWMEALCKSKLDVRTLL